MQWPCASRLSADIRSRMSVVYHRIEELKPDPTNPRLHSKKQIRQIANSIKAFGFNVPILIDRDLKVIAGHGRLSACRELGWSEVPTLCLDHLTPAQARAFRIADNRLTEIAAWDDRLLAEQLKETRELQHRKWSLLAHLDVRQVVIPDALRLLSRRAERDIKYRLGALMRHASSNSVRRVSAKTSSSSVRTDGMTKMDPSVSSTVGSRMGSG